MARGKRAGRRLVPTETISVALTREDSLNAFGIISNISEYGACLITNVSLERNRIVRVQLSSPQHESLLMTEARVSWCAEGVDPVKAIVGVMVGVSFLNLDGDQQRKMAELLSSDRFQEVLPPETPEEEEVLLASEEVDRIAEPP